MKEKSIINKLLLKKKLFIGGVDSEGEIGILVDTMGRVNYGPELFDEKGIIGGVRIGNRYHFGKCLFLVFCSLPKFQGKE